MWIKKNVKFHARKKSTLSVLQLVPSWATLKCHNMTDWSSHSERWKYSTVFLASFSGIMSIIVILLIYTENSHSIDCVDNVMGSLSDRIAQMCRSSLNVLHEVFYCKADIVKAMCLYLLGGLQGQGMIASLN